METVAYDDEALRRAAGSMIASYGRYAAQVAMKRARNLGDDSAEARQTWRRIIATIAEMEAPNRQLW
jgi:hypothetical protein